MDQVIVFEKSLQQRLQEYQNLFDNEGILPVSRIEQDWSFFLELSLDTAGWQAVWKIQRRTCEALNIPFPTVVLVLVERIDFLELTAFVKVFAVQDDIHLPHYHHVPLMNLWPTKEQDRTVVLNMENTANSLDMLRFFYNHLLMPWDYDDDDTMDWRQNLETRLRLYYDMKNGTIPVSMAGHIHSLISDAKKTQMQREELEGDLDSDVGEEDHSDSHLQKLADLHVTMLEIKAEVEILENPILREAVIRRQKNALNKSKDIPNIWVTLADGPIASSLEFLSKVAKLYPNDTVKYSPLSISLETYGSANDTFLISEATHEINSIGVLELGGLLKGVGNSSNITLTSQSKGVMMDFSGDTTTIENLTIDGVSSQCVIVVRRGQLTLSNCMLFGDGKSSIHQGILLMNGAKLVLSNCSIRNFTTAIIGNSGSIITIENSEIYDCNYGIIVYEKCSLTALKTTIRNCKKYGICMEAETCPDSNTPHVGNFDILNMYV